MANPLIQQIPESLKNLTILKKFRGYVQAAFEDTSVLSRNNSPILGVDPGRNYGITILSGGVVHIYSGKFPIQETNHHYGIVMCLAVHDMIQKYNVVTVGIEELVMGMS